MKKHLVHYMKKSIIFNLRHRMHFYDIFLSDRIGFLSHIGLCWKAKDFDCGYRNPPLSFVTNVLFGENSARLKFYTVDNPEKSRNESRDLPIKIRLNSN
jgi:hypothetical protein